ncbi:hypothetical protein I4F81_011232 [Pyropia yezoensis]|uniref:Uncharacterized protein n=1 Tax=Pyropia yezoensis TaxID=2788 RepID=A0ACC3CFP1_PYRYE|nr:hypothetical protein I4F81_011232 [Neopyropia yezoensis]
MEVINAVIQKLEVKSGRYFDKHNLPTVVSVSRFGPNVRGVIGVSVATLLLVATKEQMFCTIVSDVMAHGRVPTMSKIPLLAATRHDFETAALEDPEVLVSDVLDQGADHRVADDADAAAPALVMADAIEETPVEDLEKEMDLLLAQEKEQERASNRSHRIAGDLFTAETARAQARAAAEAGVFIEAATRPAGVKRAFQSFTNIVIFLGRTPDSLAPKDQCSWCGIARSFAAGR